MNIVKKTAVAAAFLCAATVANADDGLKIGGKVQYIASQPTGDGGKDADMSFLGFGAGVAAKIPLGAVSVNPGVDFLYTKPYSMTIDLGMIGKYEYSISELAISIPVTVQYDISGAYVGAGVQAGIPISSTQTVKVSGTPGGVADGEVSADTPDRASLDFGIAIVAGYNISDNISAGAKTVIGLTETAKDSKTKYNQYSVDVTYFF